MKTCEQFKPQLADLAAGALPDSERQAVESHLRECANCASELRQLSDIGHLLNALPQEEPPADLWLNVKAAIQQENSAPAPMRLTLGEWLTGLFTLPRLAYAGAIAAAIIALSIWLMPSPQPTQVVESADENFVERHAMLAWHDPLRDKASWGLVIGLATNNKDTP